MLQWRKTMTIECAKPALDSSLSLREDQSYHTIIDAQIKPWSPTELYWCGCHCISWHGEADRTCYDTEPEQQVLQRRDILSWSHRVQRFLRPARMNEEGRHIAHRVVLSPLASTSQGSCTLPTAMLMPPSTPIWRSPSLEAGNTTISYTRSSAVTDVGTCEDKLNHSTGTW